MLSLVKDSISVILSFYAIIDFIDGKMTEMLFLTDKSMQDAL